MPYKLKTELPPTYYFMSCGCKLHEHGLKRRYNQKVCADHGGYLLRRTRPCFDCGKEIQLCKKGNGKLRCQECEAINLKVLKNIADKKYAENHRKKIKAAAKVKPEKPKRKKVSPDARRKSQIKQKMKGWTFDERGDYCRKLFMCRKTFKDLPCVCCDNFSGVYFGFDPLKIPGYMRNDGLTFL